MSITTSNCYQICNAPTNLSPTKMLFSFPKQQRFQRQTTVHCDHFYESKNMLSKRATGFGYGYKYDFTKESPQTPPPNLYKMQEGFVKKGKKGISFGVSRGRMMITGPLVDTITNRNPGPGNYQSKSIRTNISYSLSAKCNLENTDKSSIPGPGQYATCFTINKDGKYYQTKYKNSCAKNFGKSLGRCQTQQKLKIPGVGAYDIIKNQDISPQGRYCLSQSQNCLARSFGNSSRHYRDVRTETPGPGNYKLPSQFGYYCDAKYVFGKQNKQAPTN